MKICVSSIMTADYVLGLPYKIWQPIACIYIIKYCNNAIIQLVEKGELSACGCNSSHEKIISMAYSYRYLISGYTITNSNKAEPNTYMVLSAHKTISLIMLWFISTDVLLYNQYKNSYAHVTTLGNTWCFSFKTHCCDQLNCVGLNTH